MNALALPLLALVALATSCEDAAPPPAAPTLVADPADPDTPVASPADPSGPGASPSEPPADCPFRVADTCYPDADAACNAAGCALDSCRVMESYPAQVSCN